MDLLISEIKSAQAVSRASDLGATLDVYKGANSTMAGIEFGASFTSASGGNLERYTDAEVAALYGGNGTLTSKVTSYDSFVYTVGGRSVTVTLTLASGATSDSITVGSGILTSPTLINLPSLSINTLPCGVSV